MPSSHRHHHVLCRVVLVAKSSGPFSFGGHDELYVSASCRFLHAQGESPARRLDYDCFILRFRNIMLSVVFGKSLLSFVSHFLPLNSLRLDGGIFTRANRAE